MSMGFLLEPEREAVVRGPMLHGIMQQFLRQVDWGPLDYLVIDLPPGTGDVPLTLAQSLPLTGAVVVCTPQEVALLDATRAITMFRQLKVPVLGMIENMSFFDVVAYLRERGGPEAHRLIDAKSFFDSPGDERVYLFGHGGARRPCRSSSAYPSWARCRSTFSSARPAMPARWNRRFFPARPRGRIS